jgi:hypothetical protein
MPANRFATEVGETLESSHLFDWPAVARKSSPMTHRAGIRLAEIGFLLLLFAGIWLTAAQIPAFRFAKARTIVAGIALAGSGVLLIIATHWGHFR